MAHTFVVSDESVNCYGYRVLTDGIELIQFKKNPIMLYMHRRNTWNPTGDEVIGRWENIRKENGKLLADAVFDETNEFGKKIAEKVKNGFIKMASIGISKKETSTEKKHLKTGQTRATVTKSSLSEISIVDMGGNDNALKLYNDNGEELALEELNIKNDSDMSNLKSVAITLGLDAEASDTEVLSAITTLKTGKETAETKLQAFETAQKAAQTKEAKELVNKASEALNLKDDAKTSFETTYLTLFDADHDNTKAALNGVLAGVVTTKTPPSNQATLNNFIKDVGGNAGGKNTQTAVTFDYLSKHDSAELKRIKSDEPETFAELVADYAKGVRHKQ
ncbi:HK97 family phage prohead protease [Tenacibaculum maritimum]|nr:HK97 family phage prohead protease [Tenacibaculum maritimum]MDB0612162.1 HK97 family phage prohead protease [Tenacibaculum maritimum]